MSFIALAARGLPLVGKAGPKVLMVLAVGTAGAVTAGTKGTIDAIKGRGIRKEASARLADALAELGSIEAETEQLAREYGAFQIQVHELCVGRFADWLEANQAKVKRLSFKKIDGVRIRVPNIPQYVAGAEAITVGISGAATAVGAGVAAPAAALWGVSTFASAGTGATIASLHGAAATNATLAALGGGTLATGGGGMAAGAAVLGFTAVVPALLVGGFTLGIAGARAKTRSRSFAAEIDLEIERAGLAQDMLQAVQRRIEDLRSVLEQMSLRAKTALDALESVAFDPAAHASEFLRAFQLVTAVKEILNAHVLDPNNGELSEASIEILRKYE